MFTASIYQIDDRLITEDNVVKKKSNNVIQPTVVVLPKT